MPLYHEKGLVGNKSLRCYHIPSTVALEQLFFFTHTGCFFVNEAYRIVRRDGMLSEPYMLMYTVKGRMFLEQDGIAWEAREGEILLFDCRKAHTYYSDQLSTYLFLLFGGNISEYYVNKLCPRNQHLVHPGNTQAVFHCLSDIVHASDTVMPEEHIISAEIHRLLSLLITPGEDDASPHMMRIRHVIQYMKDHLDQNISMSELADVVGLNAEYLSRIFRHYMEMSPYDYLLNMRVIRARHLLITTTDSVSTIGERCGFRDTSHFIRIFKAKTQSTPLDFRKANRGNGT